MLNLLWRLIAGGARITEDELHQAYRALVLVFLGMMVLVLVMWALNALGLKSANFVFFFLGGALLLIMGFTPRVVGASAVAGVVVHRLQDKDMSRGAVHGVEVLSKVVLGVVFGFWVASGILATWSFEQAPMAFFPIIAMIMVLAVMSSVFGLKNKKVPVMVVTIYAVAIIAAAVWETIPKDTKKALTPPPFAATTPVAAKVQTAPVHKMVLQKGVRSESLALPNDLCIKWWGAKGPDGKEFAVWVRGMNDSNWHTWEDFQSLRNAGKLTYRYPAWIAFEGLEENAYALYSFYPLSAVDCR